MPSGTGKEWKAESNFHLLNALSSERKNNCENCRYSYFSRTNETSNMLARYCAKALKDSDALIRVDWKLRRCDYYSPSFTKKAVEVPFADRKDVSLILNKIVKLR